MNINNDKNVNIKNFVNLPVKQEKAPMLPVAFGGRELPSVYPAGQSQINANRPVSYSLIGEIPVPGLKENAKVYKLSNGQRVIVAPKKGPAFIRTTYAVGSLNEPDNIRGISHFIEHNLFNGSKNLAPKEYDKKVSELGGDTNASTSFAYTDYYLQLQLLNDNSLEQAIQLNANQTQYPTFPNEQLIKEKEPVKSEIDMCGDNPETVALCKTLKNLFKIQTSSEDFVIGTKDIINSLNREIVLDYFNTWYTPDNAVTVVSGDVDCDETIKLISKYFNKQNDYSNINKRHYEPLKYNDKPVREDIIKSNTTQPSVTLGFAIPEGTAPAELNKIETLLSVINSTDSDFYKSLDNLGASFDFFTEDMQNKPFGAKAILLTVKASEEKLEEVIKTVYSQITKISNYPPSFDKLNNSKKSIINGLLSVSESSESLNGLLTNIALNNDYNYIHSSISNIQNIMPNDIALTARKYLDLNKVSMCVSHCMEATKESVEKQHKTSKIVSFGAKISPVNRIKEETAKIHGVTLPNNIQSSVLPGNPYAKSVICLNFDTDELNKTSYSAIAVLNEMLFRGSSHRGADNYNNILNSEDISQTFIADTDGLSVISECGSENIQNSIALIKEKLMYPNFTQQEFERAKQIIKDSVSSEQVSAYDKLYKELHGELTKYNDKQTRLKELEKLTLADVTALYSKIINTSQVQALMNAPVDVNPNLTAIFNSELSFGLPVFRPFSLQKEKNYNIYVPNSKEKILTEEREQAQAEVVQGYKYKKPENIDDIAKINLLNLILGAGGMSSRLFLDLREDKKLAYRVKSRIDSEKDTSVLSLKIDTTTQSPNNNEGSPENIKKALEGFSRNVNLLKNQNVTEKELKDAKTKYKTMILNDLETNMSKSLSFMESKYTHYGFDFNEKLFEAIDKVTANDIRAAANFVFANPPVISIAASKNTLQTLKLPLA